MMGLGFWIFLSVFWACETAMYLKGHNTFLYCHKTAEEKAIRARQTGAHEEPGADETAGGAR